MAYRRDRQSGEVRRKNDGVNLKVLTKLKSIKDFAEMVGFMMNVLFQRYKY